MAKEIAYNHDIRLSMQSGVDQLADAIKATLGPKGRNALMDKDHAAPFVTNDGYSISKEFDLPNPGENMGAQLIRQITAKLKDSVGDGSSTAIVMAQQILQDGIKNITAGANPVAIRRGIQKAVHAAVSEIHHMAKPVEHAETLAHLAAIASGEEEIGTLVADALKKVGMDGVVTVETSNSLDTTLEMQGGMQYNKGYLSVNMVTDMETMSIDLSNPYILVTDEKISSCQQILPILEEIHAQGRSLLIIAEAVEGDALTMLIRNKMSGILNVAAVHPPAYGNGRISAMEDIALYTGGKFLTSSLGYDLSQTTTEQLGSAESVHIDEHNTVFLNGHGDPAEIEIRRETLRRRISNTSYEFDRNQLQERLSRLSNGVCVLHVGGATDTAIQEKKLRTENALHAAKAALAEGIVPGGGTAYLHILPAVQTFAERLEGDEKIGAQIILRALEAPAHQIAANAGLDAEVIIAKIKSLENGMGYDVMKDTFTDMIASGIIDSAKVQRLALQSAASVCSVMLTSQAGVMEIKE